MDSKSTSSWLKIVGAILLLSCFALPMTSCTQYKDADGKAMLPNADGSYAPDAQKVVTRQYIVNNVRATEPTTWLFVVAFVWPATLVLYGKLRPASRVVRGLWFIEPLLMMGTLFMVYAGGIANDYEIGSYVACVGVTSCFVAWTMEAIAKFKARRTSA